MGGLKDFIFGSNDPDPVPPIPSPDIQREGAQAADRTRRKRRRIAARGGRASTILSQGPRLGQATVGRQTLGGGT